MARIEASKFYRYACSDVSVEDIRAQAELILVEQTRRYDPARKVPFRAFLAMQLRLRLWNMVRRDRDHRGSEGPILVELTEDLPAAEDLDSMDAREVLTDLASDPDTYVALGLVASGLTPADAALRGISEERYDALLFALRAKLGS